MNKKLLSLSLASLIGLSIMTGFANANETTTTQETVTASQEATTPKKDRKKSKELTEEQKQQIENAYNSLTDEEKELFDKYIKKTPKEELENLTEEERNSLKEAKKQEMESLTDEQKQQIKDIKTKVFGTSNIGKRKSPRLTEEERQAFYNTLTEEEKAVYDKYIKKTPKEEFGNLTEEERNSLKETKKQEMENLTDEQKQMIKSVKDKMDTFKEENTNDTKTINTESTTV